MPDTVSTPETEAAAGRLARIAHTENLAKLGGIYVTLVLVIVLIFVSISQASRQKDVPNLARQETASLVKLNTVVGQLAEAAREQKCQSSSNAAAFALILHDIAAGFGTPPFPDSDRQKAVDGLNATADLFDRAAKHPPANPCNPRG